jgi:NADH dehydrogenase
MAVDLVTGAFSYSGRFLTEGLLKDGRQVRTLTNHPRPDLFADQVVVYPLQFEGDLLAQALTGIDTVYNTYWVRFPYASLDFQIAVRNSGALIRSARVAGVRRFVHVSIANPSVESPHPYYRGKAAVEQDLTTSGLSYAIVRPTVIYGEGDVLMNNIAWFIRHLPIFGIPGSGRYRIQPVFVRDHVDLMRKLATIDDPIIVDSVGPDDYTFDELLRMMRSALHSRTALVKLPPPVVLLALRAFGALVRDVILTHNEVGALMDDLLVSHAAPTCPTRFDTWLGSHADELGHRFASEVERHFRRQPELL